MANLSTLIERVEALTGPDREVDLDVAIATGMVSDEVSKYGPHLRRIEARRVDPYTASLDAAVALVEQVLPGWSGDVDIGVPIADSGKVGARLFPPEPGWANYAGEGLTSAIALVLAALRALHAQEERDG